MGWSHAPGIFTDLISPVVREIRTPGWRRRSRQGVPGRILWYIDDFLLMGKTAREVEALRDRTASLFESLGLAMNPKKCQWDPVQALLHLGLVVDTRTGHFRVDPARLRRIQTQAKTLLQAAARQQRRVPKRDLAAFTGLAQFTSLAVRSARFRSRSLYDAMGTLQGWGGHVRLSRQAQQDLRWWTRLTAAEAERPIWPRPPTATLHTDSSGYAWGAWLNEGTTAADHARGTWAEAEAADHITALELRAVTRAVATFLPQLRGKVVTHWEDNQAVVAVLTKLTSPAPAMMTELRVLHKLLDDYSIELQTRYIPTDDNVVADGLSRTNDETAWELRPEVFLALGGPLHTVDRFASAINTRLPRFNTRWPQPGAEATDALAVADDEWAATVSWCNPPWSLLERLAAKLQRSKGAATVIAPFWPGARWYPLLSGLATQVVRLPASAEWWRAGPACSSPAKPPPAWDMQAFCIHTNPPCSDTLTVGSLLPDRQLRPSTE